ncbi:hypothetical protein BDE02_19G100100 [Populus trichocarpa]|nr:hypothetical protein BDE02_19G100100 [Populus trichocarpa]
MFFWCMGTKTMTKVYWLTKATFFPLLLFFVRFSSGLTSFNSLSVLSPSTSLHCSLFLVCPLCFCSSSSIVFFFFCLCFSFLSLCLFFLSSWFSLFFPTLLFSSTRSFNPPLIYPFSGFYKARECCAFVPQDNEACSSLF